MITVVSKPVDPNQADQKLQHTKANQDNLANQDNCPDYPDCADYPDYPDFRQKLQNIMVLIPEPKLPYNPQTIVCLEKVWF